MFWFHGLYLVQFFGVNGCSRCKFLWWVLVARYVPRGTSLSQSLFWINVFDHKVCSGWLFLLPTSPMIFRRNGFYWMKNMLFSWSWTLNLDSTQPTTITHYPPPTTTPVTSGWSEVEQRLAALYIVSFGLKPDTKIGLDHPQTSRPN